MQNKFLSVKELPFSERPYERCIKYGAGVLSDAELLAVIIRTGSKNERSVDLAGRILNSSQSYSGLIALNHLRYHELIKIKGIGSVKAVQLLCVAELSKRIALSVRDATAGLNNPEDAAWYYMESMRHLEREQLRVVFLDTKHRILSEKIMFEGTVGMSIMEPREILIEALKANAVNFIILHNHPSGDPTPSSQDISATSRIYEAGKLIGIHLSDHIIIGDNKYVSMKSYGLF